MAFDIGVIPETVTRALTDRTLIPVIGAGLSKQSNPNFPTWSELLAMLVAYAAEQHFITPPETVELQEMLCGNNAASRYV